MLETMELVEKQGKTRFIGTGTHDPNAMVDSILKVGKFGAVQTTHRYAIGITETPRPPLPRAPAALS